MSLDALGLERGQVTMEEGASRAAAKLGTSSALVPPGHLWPGPSLLWASMDPYLPRQAQAP